MNSKNKYLKLKDLVVGSVKEGVKDRELSSEAGIYWFQSFGYSQNPLNVLIREENLSNNMVELFVNRSSEIELISRYFGSISKFPNNLHFAIIGSKGNGKHITLKIICSLIQESFPSINFEFYGLETSYDYKRNIQLDSKSITKKDNIDLDVRIISCSGKNKWLFIKRFEKYRRNSKLLISIWNTRDFPLDSDIMLNKKIYFNNFMKEQIKIILLKRIEKYLIKNDKNKDYYSSLINVCVPRIAESFEGNLNLCFMVFKEIHIQAKLQDNLNLPGSIIDKVLEEYLSLKNQKITNNEKKIIQYYLSRENQKYVTTSDLRDDLNLDRTSAWKYLENLTKKRIFVREYYGNPSRYRISELFLSFYENQLKRNIIFKKA